MLNTNKENVRTALSKHYADVLMAYQDKHQRLLHALADDAVEVEEFEQMSAEVQADVNALKEIKREMKRQKDGLVQES